VTHGLPKHEYDRLLMAVTGRPRAALSRDPRLSPAEREKLDELVSRRLSGEPLQYVEGRVPFGPIDVTVDPRVLVPRPETEQVWETAVACLGEAGPGTVIVDVGTGSGVLALALKHAFGAARVIGIDLSSEALELARQNAADAGLEVEFVCGDLFEPLDAALRGRVDLVVSNPPYVTEAEWAGLPPDVRDHEPHGALVSGPDGTEVIARIAAEALWWLGIGGWVVCEIGETQGQDALGLFGDYEREVRPDLAGRDRILVARRGAPCCG
jgi:release factor glutamine methyltransferase